MDATQSRHLLLLLLLTCELAPGLTADIKETADGPGVAQGPVWLTDVPSAVEFISAAEVAIIGFFQDLEIPVVSVFHSMVPKFQDVSFGISNNSDVLAHYNITKNTISLFRRVDNKQLNIEGKDVEDIEESKLSRFIETHSLRLVTEYNAVTGIGLFNTMIEIHLLLIMNMDSSEYAESVRRYREAAKLFLGEILFVLVDSGKIENGKVVSFFRLKESQLPALAIYRTLDDQWDTLSVAEVTVERVQSFCEGFLKGKLMRENQTSEEKSPKVEL